MNEVVKKIYIAKTALQFKNTIYEPGESVTLYSKIDIEKAEAHKYLISMDKFKENQIKEEAVAALNAEKQMNALAVLQDAEAENADLKAKIAELEAGNKKETGETKTTVIENKEFKFGNTKEVEAFVETASKEKLEEALTFVKAPTYKSLISKKIEELSA